MHQHQNLRLNPIKPKKKSLHLTSLEDGGSLLPSLLQVLASEELDAVEPFSGVRETRTRRQMVLMLAILVPPVPLEKVYPEEVNNNYQHHHHGRLALGVVIRLLLALTILKIYASPTLEMMITMKMMMTTATTMITITTTTTTTTMWRLLMTLYQLKSLLRKDTTNEV